MSVSLKDIASKLNLSMTTVSWVLSGKGDEKNISKATQKRIRECAKEMAYKPNLIARSLNTGVTKTLGLILPSISDRFYSHIAEEIELEADRHGYSIMVCSSEADFNKEEKMIQMLRSKQADGIIMAPTKLSSKGIESMLKDDFPFVLFDRYYAEFDTNYVIIDNEECSYKLVKHLLEKGSRKIALIHTNPHLLTLQQRQAGYKRAHKQAGVDVDPTLDRFVEISNYEVNIVNVLDKLFAEVPDLDGFFFISHILAIETLVYMYERGIDVNNYEMACIHEVTTFRALAPKMHTAVMPVSEIGQNSVNILIEDIESKAKNGKPLPAKKSMVLTSSIYLRS